VENGELRALKIPKRVPVEEYLKEQVRFRHLFGKGDRKKEIAEIQEIADQNIEKFRLIAK